MSSSSSVTERVSFRLNPAGCFGAVPQSVSSGAFAPWQNVCFRVLLCVYTEQRKRVKKWVGFTLKATTF